MFSRFVVLLLCAVAAQAWKLPSAVNGLKARTAVKSFAAALVFATYAGNALESQHFSLSPVQAAQAAESVFVGQYDDPNHPGCLRKITVKGKDVSILGSDEIDGSKQWSLRATEDYPGTIFVDFSPKGGPSNLLGVYNEKADAIKWPDGNSWSKIPQKKG